MKTEELRYIAIDLKSFYASVECVERGLDPLTANLVVADVSRTEKTICLAVSPSLKSYGITGRARLFEVVQRVQEVNAERRAKLPDHAFTGSSYEAEELKKTPSLELSYIAAPPRMALYMDYSTRIYEIYLKYVAPEDIHVYSVDEVFIDAACYLRANKMTACEFAMLMIKDVYETTGITATAGVGTNLYLSKIAMDIVAKHITPDENGVRIAELDEMSYRRELWAHRPLTDFWRVGRGYRKKLEDHGLYTMGDIAKCSVGQPNEYYNEELLYKLFGINAELLIDHAWGWEPCTIADIKQCKPMSRSISSGQVLQSPYTFEKAKLILCEMADSLSLDLVEKGLVTDQIVLDVGFDVESLTGENAGKYKGEVTVDYYGRKLPKGAHGSANLGRKTSSERLISDAAAGIFDRTVGKELLVRRIYITANNVSDERETVADACLQLDLFTDYALRDAENAALEREHSMQKAIVGLKRRYGKNSVIRAVSLEEGATAIERNGRIGGHKA